jgi:UDP-N-acetylglucosamine 4,6-dehydratase
MLAGKTFLVTGGTGSFGRTLLDHLLKSDVEKVVCLSRDEAKQHELRMVFGDSRLNFILGDVRDPQTVKKSLLGVDYVFHAAALKHVPVSELNPWEFVQTNIIGSHNLLNSLQESSVTKAIFLSTDKAVYPVNAMGMSKAMMEKLVRSSNYSGGYDACITRYGNVIGSRGSVIPEFINALKSKSVINVTDPEMTRFLMSLSESVDLVIHALNSGNDGDLFVQKSPAATVGTILKSLCQILEIAEPNIHISGPRPGEKIHETLLNSEEKTYAFQTDRFFQVPSLSKDSTVKNQVLRVKDEYTSNSDKLLNESEVKTLLLQNQQIQSIISK